MNEDLTAKDYEEPTKDFLNRNTDPRMPWHDVACCVFGAAAGDVARHFVQRYNKNTQAQSLPEVTDDHSIHSVPGLEPSEVRKCQVLRSAEQSSTGISCTESSIYKAYLKSIEEAEHFIYTLRISFFVSTIKEDKKITGVIHNTIMQALADRVIRAYKDKKSFQVIIVIPLKPEFRKDSPELKTVAYLTHSTISGAEDSFFKQLMSGGIKSEEIPKYVSFYSLRGHDTLNGKIVTEVIYVHSKAMVVDDKVTIIGSANINDRSMLGDRDAELALIVEDECFSKALRCHLAREHLGLEETDDAVDNPVECYMKFKETAEGNTKVYDSVFGSLKELTDKVTSFEKLEEQKAAHAIYIAAAKEELTKIKGHVVPHPLHFLKDDYPDLKVSFPYQLLIVEEIFCKCADDGHGDKLVYHDESVDCARKQFS